MDLEERITSGWCLTILLVRLGLNYYHNHTWPWHINFLCLTCVERIQSSIWYYLSWCWTGWLLHTTNVSSLFYVWVKVFVFLNIKLWFDLFFYRRFLRYWSRFPRAFAMIGSICFNRCWLLRTGQMRNFLFFIVFRNVLSVYLKQNPWRYWISSVFYTANAYVQRRCKVLCFQIL